MVRQMKTMDGNTAAAHVAYAYTEVAAIFPITPSSPMAESVDEWSAHGRKNIFGQEVIVRELQSEAGAAGSVHGALVAGALTTTFTASQGLLLMVPNMYKIAGEQLPGVFHVSARALASHALSIYGDHQDVMATRQTGFALLATGSVQEVMDLAPVAHLAAIKGRVPFLHFFDGFRTSHEVQKIEVWSDEALKEMVDFDAIDAFRKKALNPEHPKTMGTAQNADIYFQGVEASNTLYTDIVGITEGYMNEVNKRLGTDYGLFNYYGAEDAERVIVCMGSVTEAAEETVDYLMAQGEKVGMIKVHLYRPFSGEHFLKAMPKTVKKIAVLDRTKEKGSLAEPLYLDVKSLYYNEADQPVIVGGIFGLGSKDTTPSHLKTVFDNLAQDEPKDDFTIGLVDDVTFKSLEVKEEIRAAEPGTIRCKFWGYGSDGTVGANKSAIKIIGDNTDMYAQGYFDYDSKKSGGLTVSHLRFGKDKIRSTYLLDEADFISCSKQSYVYTYDLLKGLKKGGTFVLNTIWNEEEVESHLPAKMKAYIAQNDIEFYTINASQIAEDIGLGNRINMVIQSAFFKLSEVLPLDQAVKLLKDSIVSSYGSKGEHIVNMNFAAVDQGISALVKIDVPAEWANAQEGTAEFGERPEFVAQVADIINRFDGYSLPVSAFKDRANGEFPNGLSAYEKRGVAFMVPEWQMDNCIQCNQCAIACPHAVIRPFLLNEEEVANAPEGFESKKAIGRGLDGMNFTIQISTMDCTGCANCANVCPSKNKALIMKPYEEQLIKNEGFWEYANEEVGYKDEFFNVETVKGSQFRQPLLEFSGACAGCGETPYVKLITQLFGDRMMIANATGCSSIWGASAPSTPYTTNACGKGPAFANSLFEDNAEFGYGYALAATANRNKLQAYMEAFNELNADQELTDLFKEWIEVRQDAEGSKAVSAKINAVLDKKTGNEEADAILARIADFKDFLVKRSVWIFGGDGWAYDIGFGGLDHVLASGEDINVLVMDTEVYSNTGGQSSKATPIAAVAQFAAAGKRVRKKDLGMIAATYGYVYVAQVAMGANMNQLMKAVTEAESYNGPSLIIAYAPCINHGIRGGMVDTQAREKLAVETGYWHLYRFDPRLKDQGKNPFQLDSKEPTKSFQEFIQTEVRYTSLKRSFPEVADELYQAAEEAAKDRYEGYKRKAAEFDA